MSKIELNKGLGNSKLDEQSTYTSSEGRRIAYYYHRINNLKIIR